MTDNQVEPEKGKKGKADDNNNNTEENPKTGKRKLPQSLQDTPEPGVRSGKRERKPAEAFDSSVYDLLNKSKRAIQVVPGRGTHKLGDIAEIQNTIRLAHDDSLDLKNAHKLLYPVRGKTLARQMRHNLLEFSGYLPVWGEADQEKIKRDKLEEDIEAKVSQRAYKLRLQEVKRLCDFFHVDRSHKATKEDLVDVLLNFLGEIDLSLLKSTNNKNNRNKNVEKPTGSIKAVTTTNASGNASDPEDIQCDSENDKEDHEEDGASEGEEDDHNYDSEKTARPKVVSDKALRNWVKAYISCFNMDKATIKHAIETASDKFGVDLKDKILKIKQLLTEEM